MLPAVTEKLGPEPQTLQSSNSEQFRNNTFSKQLPPGKEIKNRGKNEEQNRGNK